MAPPIPAQLLRLIHMALALHLPVRKLLLASAGKMAPEQFGAAVRAMGRSAIAGLDQGLIRVPVQLRGSAWEQAWRPLIAGEGEAVALGGHEPRSLEQVRPDILRGADGRAKQASAGRPASQEALREARQHARTEEERYGYEVGRLGSFSMLTLVLLALVLVASGLFFLEGALVFTGIASFYGVFDYWSLEEVPRQVWTHAGGLTFPPLVAGVILMLLLGPAIRHAWSSWSRSRFVLLAGGIVLLLLMTSVSLLRFLGTVTTGEFGGAEQNWGSMAGVAAMAISSPLIFFATVLLHPKLTSQAHALRAAWDRDRRHREQKRLLADDQVLAEDAVRRSAALSQAPDELRASFDAEVMVWAQAVRRVQATYDTQAEQAQPAFETFSSLSPATLEEVIARMVEIVPAEDAAAQDPSAKKKNGGDGGLPGPPTLVLLAFLALGGIAACGGTPKPYSLIVGGEGTGAAPGLTLSRELVVGMFDYWLARARGRPGSTIRFVFADGSFGATRVIGPIVMPERSGGSGRLALDDWAASRREELSGLEVPTDDPKEPGRNRSDLLSVLLVVAREARSLSGHEVELVLASDLWAISGPFVFEKRVPAKGEVLDYFKQQGASLDLVAVEEVFVCGPHHVGSSVGAVEARDRLWKDLLVESGTKVSFFLPSCQGLVSALERRSGSGRGTGRKATGP